MTDPLIQNATVTGLRRIAEHEFLRDEIGPNCC
jgi:hypothetical protein